MHNPPHISVTQNQNGTFSYHGYLYNIWLLIATQLHLSFRMVPHNTTPAGFGSEMENGQWDGLIGELVHNRADIALTWLVMNQARRKVIDFVDELPVAFTSDAFYVRKTSSRSRSVDLSIMEGLFKPLHKHVWWMLIVFILGSTLLLRVVTRFSRAGSEQDENHEEMTLGSTFLCIFMAMVGQGWPVTPNSVAARIATIMIWFLGIIISCSYTANLISSLTVTGEERPITSLKQFYERPQWKFTATAGTAQVQDWKVSKSIYKRDLYRRVVEKDRFIDLLPSGENVNCTIEEQTLSYGDMDQFIQLLGNKACDLAPLLDRPIQRLPCYLVMRYGRQQLKRDINVALLALRQAGVIARLERTWLMADWQTCPTRPAFRVLNFWDVLAELALVPIGVVCSTIVALLEWFRHEWYQSLRQRLLNRCHRIH